MSAQTEDIDSLLRDFGADSEDSKQQNFEASTCKLVLAQLGYTPKQIRQLERDESSNCDWINEATGIPVEVCCRRVFSFNFDDLLWKPEKHPISLTYKTDICQEADRHAPIAWVFRVYGYGRAVCTDLDSNSPVLCRDWARMLIPNPLDHDSLLTIVPFTNFFTHWREARDDV